MARYFSRSCPNCRTLKVETAFDLFKRQENETIKVESDFPTTQ
jgi:hypothetical protein